MTRGDYQTLWFAIGFIGTIVMLFVLFPVKIALLVVFAGIMLLALKAGAQ